MGRYLAPGAGCPTAKMQDGDRGRVNHKALEIIERQPQVMGHQQLEWVGMRDADYRISRTMLGA